MLRRIRTSGYKSIRECDITFGKINVLIGSNGAGKSNFLSVFDLLQNIISKNLQVFVAQNGVNALLRNREEKSKRITLNLFFDDYSYGFTLVPTAHNRLFFQKEHMTNWEWCTLGTDLNIDSAHSESIMETAILQRDEDNEKFLFPFRILQNQNFRIYHFNDTGRSSKVKQEHNISNNKVLMHDAANLAAFLYRLKENFKKNYDEIVKTIQLIAPYFSDFVLDPKEGNEEQIVLKWQQKGCDDIFNASQLSDGTLRFICLATLLLQPRELQPTTIIIDEPELGLHPYVISIFAEMVKQLGYNRQIIISTQSVELLKKINADNVIIADRCNNVSVLSQIKLDH